MDFIESHGLEQSRWSDGIGRLIDALCFAALLAVIGTVIYGCVLRAIWAHGYYVAVAAAVLGGLTMMVGLAQQAIAARDAATWREMAMWQLRAAREKVGGGRSPPVAIEAEGQPSDSPAYYEHLVEVLLESVQRGDEEGTARWPEAHR